jgi:hypothetical protein
MKTKNTVFLLIVAIVIFGAIIFLNKQEQDVTTSAAIPVQTLPAVTSGTVQRIAIHAPGEKQVTLTRSAGKWYTNVEKKYEADQSAVTQILSAIDEPIDAKVVSSNPDSYGDYEVSETSGTKVKIFTTGKTEPALDLVVGKDGPSAFSTYVRMDGEDAVLNAHASLSMTFKRPDGWRNKQIFSFPGNNATRIEATGTSQTFAFAKQGGDKWMMESPEKAEAESARVDSIANMLSSLRANEFIDPSSSQTLASFGLEPARQTFSLTYEDKSTSPSKSESVTLEIGNESATKGDWYAKRKDRNDIFTIGQHVADALVPDPKTLLVAKPEPTPAPEATTTATEAAAAASPPAPAATPASSPAITPAPPPTVFDNATTATDTGTTTP